MSLGHRIRIVIGVTIALGAPVWLVCALIFGGAWLPPAVLEAQVVYYLIVGFREGLHRSNRDLLVHRLKVQEELAQGCVRRHGGFFWPKDNENFVRAYGEWTDTVVRL